MNEVRMFSSKVRLQAGEPLGGSDPERFSAEESDALEVNGVCLMGDDGQEYRLCSIDALYPGKLVEKYAGGGGVHIFAASHTHYAPMLDDNKPLIGYFSPSGLHAYVEALETSTKTIVQPTRYSLYRGEVDVPVYRRFDFPQNFLNRWLTQRCGFYPNDSKQIDRSICILVFGDAEKDLFAVVHHACHPVTLGVSCEVSADYVGAIRAAVRERFSLSTVLFFQGCAGDIRPNLAQKRFGWLPRMRLNWRFNWRPDKIAVEDVYCRYSRAVTNAIHQKSFELTEGFRVRSQEVSTKGHGVVPVSKWAIPGGVEFHFFPFELSHLYHLTSQKSAGDRFIVSCANDVLGYLSHPSQYSAGGYEVEGSLHFMGLTEKIEIKEAL
ncbi:MAG: hypothetical protein RLZZ153_49 [Pseudomonadota bacterium]